MQVDGSCSSADVAAERHESEWLAVNLAVSQRLVTHAPLPGTLWPRPKPLEPQRLRRRLRRPLTRPALVRSGDTVARVGEVSPPVDRAGLALKGVRGGGA